MPGNQEPEMPWPNSLLLLSAVASVTTQLRLVAGAIIAPLRHPLLLARELGTLDLISQGRLVVQPTVSWSRDEYAALNVPFQHRGKILDEQLEILEVAWKGGPFSYAGEYFQFTDVTLEPRAHRPDGPRLWFGGQSLSPAVLRRLVRWGHGFHPLGDPAADDLAQLQASLRAVSRDLADLEKVGGTRAVFTDDHHPADLGRAMEPVRQQLADGYTTICVKPSQFIDDARELEGFCHDVIRRAAAMVS
jgi:alkanesulfonate monooxygenase SsuD/methylene tetrahydromethanopterin reductase-like flavin-dependent oxidoreductase (luciferase family)